MPKRLVLVIMGSGTPCAAVNTALLLLRAVGGRDDEKGVGMVYPPYHSVLMSTGSKVSKAQTGLVWGRRVKKIRIDRRHYAESVGEIGLVLAAGVLDIQNLQTRLIKKPICFAVTF